MHQRSSPANMTPSPKRRRKIHLRSTPTRYNSRKNENISPPRPHKAPREFTEAQSPLHSPVKEKARGSSSTSKFSHKNAELCDEHIQCNPVSRATIRMYAGMVCNALKTAGITICAEKPALVFPLAAGFEVLDTYADNIGNWDECCICTVTDILLGPGQLPLMVGLLVLRRYSIYQKCIAGMRLYLAEKQVNEMDEGFRELAHIHLKYMEDDIF